MLSYAQVQNQPRVLQSLTEITVAEFEDLLVSLVELDVHQTRLRVLGHRMACA
jgi:hypothetical protein